MKAIILAWGHGTRMLPINKTIPKELLPVWNKPVIQYIVEALVYAGVNDILIVTSQSKKALEDYFDKNYELEQKLRSKGKDKLLEAINIPKNLANFAFVKQKEALGTGHAILQAGPWVADDYFLVVNGDMIYPKDSFKQMIDLHNSTHKPVWLLKEIPMQDTYKYGIAKIEDKKIVDIVEKPNPELAPSNLMNTGTFLWPQEAFNLLAQTQPEPSGEIYPWFAAKNIIENMGILPSITEGIRDIGDPNTWLEANVYLHQNGSLF